MFKWHVHSAIGRSRPLTNDFIRAADGIAGSLRQFSISVSKAAQDGGESSKPTRVERTRDAIAEVSSLPKSRPSRGIDARSLAAKPPGGFTITRQLGDYPERAATPRVTASRGGALTRGTGARGGAFTRGPGARGGGITRGQRGGRGGTSRGGNRGNKSRSTRNGSGGRPPSEEEDDHVPDYTDAEIKRLDLIHGGFPTPYEPTTTLEALGTPVLSSDRGLVENIKYKMQVATSNVNGVHKIGGEHIARMERGDGTLFESAEAKTIVQDFNNQIRKERAEKFGWEFEPKTIRSLPQAEREALAKKWAAGQYELPKKTPELHDVLGQVASYARRNETYLVEDGKKLEEKLKSLLPAQQRKGDLAKPVSKAL